MRGEKVSWVVLVIALVLVWPAVHSEAIPTFARKYETSCQTCHTAYPKLNPFGEAFRINGFEWPGGFDAEEENTKEDPVPLGAEAYKRVFPDAVYPGAIPGNVPISFRARTGFQWEDRVDGDRSEFIAPTLQTMMSGTMGEHLSFFVGAHLFEEGTFQNASLDRFYLRTNDLLSSSLPEDALNLRIGQFIPEMVTYVSNHRGLTITPFAFNTYSPGAGAEFGAAHVHGEGGDGHVDDHGKSGYRYLDEGHGEEEPHALPEGPVFGIENFQLGIEASGVLQQRFRFVLGVVNGGTGPETNAAKDLYGRLAYKLGGMALDGSGGALTEKNWAERSVTLGVFGYTGKALNEHESGPADLDVQRFGADANVYVDNLNLFGGVLFAQDQLLQEARLVEVDFTSFFAEVDYVLLPWLIAVLRYEQADPDGFETIRRVVPHVTALYRANVKLQLETRFDPDDADLDVFLIGLDFAY